VAHLYQVTRTSQTIYVLHDSAQSSQVGEGQMRTSVMLMALVVAAPAFAQSPVYSNADLGKPLAAATRLSPDEAVRVLRSSHSIADLTDYRSPGSGPTIVVMGESSTPWDWPATAFEPIRPLGNYFDGNLYAPMGYGYAPYYATSYFNRPRHSGFGHTAMVTPAYAVQTAPPPPARTVQTMAPPPARSSAPGHIVTTAQAAGRRR
jgi:hypothetical protein